MNSEGDGQIVSLAILHKACMGLLAFQTFLEYSLLLIM